MIDIFIIYIIKHYSEVIILLPSSCFQLDPRFQFFLRVAKMVVVVTGVGPGKDSGIPAMFAREGEMTEERIAHILSEASQMMKTEDSLHSNDDSRSPTQPQVNKQSLQLRNPPRVWTSLRCTNKCLWLLWILKIKYYLNPWMAKMRSIRLQNTLINFS